MTLEELYDFCLSFPDVTEHFPFDEETLVFKVSGKMFALVDVTLVESINLKCDPNYAIQLRAEYQEVQPGYHMNKKLWNTVSLKGQLKKSMVKQWIADSYQLVVAGMTKSKREEIKKALEKAPDFIKPLVENSKYL